MEWQVVRCRALQHWRAAYMRVEREEGRLSSNTFIAQRVTWAGHRISSCGVDCIHFL